MERTKIFARNIQHLTDARYFSAMGVDWMSFDLRPTSNFYISELAFEAIKEWVEGPGFCIENDGKESKVTVLRNFEETNPSHEGVLQINVDDWMEYEKEIITTKAILLKTQDINHLIENRAFFETQKVPYYIDANISAHEVQRIVDHLPNAGIVLYGAAEEKLGFKNYDEINEIIENFIG